MENRNQVALVKKLDKIFKKYPPKILQSVNEFNSNEMKKLCEKYKIKLIFSVPYKPQSNGCVENFYKFLKSQIYKYMTNAKTKVWINVVDKVVKNYNNNYHSTIKNTPRIVFETKDNEIIENIKSLADKMLSNSMTVNKLEKFNVGDHCSSDKS